jgi:hypothetical protein
MSEATAIRGSRTTTTVELVDRYVALWNEPDADLRRQMIAELWTVDGCQFVEPPQEIREIAARPGIGMSAILEARGHDEIAARVASSYGHWVAVEGLRFRRCDDAKRLGDVVTFHWEAVAEHGGTSPGGLNVLVLAADGRIERDYVFVLP